MIVHQLSKPRLSTAGKWGSFLIILMVLSFRSDLRVPIAGLLVHPYLVFLPLAFVFSNFYFNVMPSRVVVPLIVFYVIFCIACLQNENPVSEMFKVGASIGTFIFCTFAVRTERDFEWMSWGLMICASTIGVMGFLEGEEGVSEGSRLAGINVLEGIGNKNAQSLFTLPGVFLGSYSLINAIKQKKYAKVTVLATLMFFTIISIFLSANRSGWVGLAIIAVSTFFVLGLKGRTVLYGVVIGIFTYLAVDRYAADIVERKSEQTTKGYSSDIGRQMLMLQSMTVGLENPILGVGMDELHKQMALRLKLTRFRVYKTDTHFLPGYIFGSSGIMALIFFFLFLYGMTRPMTHFSSQNLREARYMVIFFVILFVVRSFFTREILYSPTFISGLGVVFGFYIMRVREAHHLMPGRE